MRRCTRIELGDCSDRRALDRPFYVRCARLCAHPGSAGLKRDGLLCRRADPLDVSPKREVFGLGCIGRAYGNVARDKDFLADLNEIGAGEQRGVRFNQPFERDLRSDWR